MSRPNDEPDGHSYEGDTVIEGVRLSEDDFHVIAVALRLLEHEIRADGFWSSIPDDRRKSMATHVEGLALLFDEADFGPDTSGDGDDDG
jgi:hypothetical protein